jgi:hypothetical protein
MPKDNISAYVIVELLIRLANHEPQIGNYKTHAVHEDGVLVKTSTGVIQFNLDLIKKQFECPEKITVNELSGVASSFKSACKSKPF